MHVARPALLAALVLLAALRAARASDGRQAGTGSAPATPGFDPTGSHPLPNEGVEERAPSAAGGSAGGGCGCVVPGRPAGSGAAGRAAVPFAVAVALRVWRRRGPAGGP